MLLVIPSVMASGYTEWYDPIPDDVWNRTININYTFLEVQEVEKIQFNIWNNTETRPRSLYILADSNEVFNGSITWVTDNIGLVDVNTNATKWELYIYDSYNATVLRLDEVLFLEEPRTIFFFEQTTTNIVVFTVILLLLSITSFVSAMYGLRIMKYTASFGIIVIGIMMMVSGWNFIISLFVTLIPLIFIFETEE